MAIYKHNVPSFRFTAPDYKNNTDELIELGQNTVSFVGNLAKYSRSAQKEQDEFAFNTLAKVATKNNQLYEDFIQNGLGEDQDVQEFGSLVNQLNNKIDAYNSAIIRRKANYKDILNDPEVHNLTQQIETKKSQLSGAIPSAKISQQKARVQSAQEQLMTQAVNQTGNQFAQRDMAYARAGVPTPTDELMARTSRQAQSGAIAPQLGPNALTQILGPQNASPRDPVTLGANLGVAPNVQTMNKGIPTQQKQTVPIKPYDIANIINANQSGQIPAKTTQQAINQTMNVVKNKIEFALTGRDYSDFLSLPKEEQNKQIDEVLVQEGINVSGLSEQQKNVYRVKVKSELIKLKNKKSKKQKEDKTSRREQIKQDRDLQES